MSRDAVRLGSSECERRCLLNLASDRFFQTFLTVAIIDRISVYKLIGVILAAVPIVLFLKAIMGQSRKRSQAVSDFKKHMDLCSGSSCFLSDVE